ncbi:YxeA family protein [Paenibacillus sp. 481]|nr:YxeA family protein [Paenibacillus sp. 481]
MVVVVFGVVLGAGLVLSGVDLAKVKQQWGATKMYVQITNNGDKQGADEDSSRYYYQLKAYDKDGTETPITFSAHKNLKQNAYLLVHVREYTDDRGNHEVATYEEIQSEEIPQKAKEKMDNTVQMTN